MGKNKKIDVANSERKLKERVKELTCLYDMSEFSQKSDMTITKFLNHIIKIIPPAWQYPDITAARIIFDDKSYSSHNFKETSFKQIEDIIVDKQKRGTIEVYYLKKMPTIDEGPFLNEERKLLQVITRKVKFDIERLEANEVINEYQEQLRHADRLATIGEFTASIAHELNNPLNNILGFAQLLNKSTDITEQCKQDVEKIIKSALHSREIIKKLMYFTRQMPHNFEDVNLNNVVKSAMYFLEPQCKKENITIKYSIKKNLPIIFADNLQLIQVIVNLVLNAIQAMQKNGILTISTYYNNESVFIGVEDTGVGIPKSILPLIFNPFFTTKVIGKGTGLGLSVAHGIVMKHKGKINIESIEGKGTKFEVELPIKYN